MRKRFYGPIVEQTILQLDVLRHSEFLSIFQGLVLCGPRIFNTDALNAVLNNFVSRLNAQDNEEEESLEFKEVVTCCELIHNYSISLEQTNVDSVAYADRMDE